MSTLKKTNGKYLWWSLQCLEFQPKNTARLQLGTNMFDHPNKDAFYLVIHFLFVKLNPARAHDVFRTCWPVLDHKLDAMFRKVTFSWLQEIANEEGSSFPKVVASHLLSAFGPRFINLMLHLAKHVIVKTIKTFTSDVWVPEAAALTASSCEMELKRFLMVRRQFQRVMVEQDCFIRQYQKKAKQLEMSIQDLEAERARYSQLLGEHENVDLKLDEIPEKIQKVRAYWAEVNRVISTLEKEQQVMENVISGQADQYSLDGKELHVKIPIILLKRMERISNQSVVGGLSGGQSVLVRLVELLNQGLQILSEERKQIVASPVQLQYKELEEQTLLFSHSKENLMFIRRKLVKEDAAEVKNSIKRLEEDLAENLKKGPSTAFFTAEPVLDFFSPMAPLSFEPASDTSFETSIISQYPHNLSEIPLPSRTEPCKFNESKDHLGKENEVSLLMESPALLSSGNCFSFFPETRDETLALVMDVQPEVQTLSPVEKDQMYSSARKTIDRMNLQSQKKTPVSKCQILDLEFENLANEFAEAVITSPVTCQSDVDLGHLLNVISDPFSTRKQLCRTPERLIQDVRSSWRKAMEEDVEAQTPTLKKTRPSPESSLLFRSTISPPHAQKEASLDSTVSWDNTKLATHQNSNDFIKFNVAQEEFPDLFNDISFNSDGSVEIHSNEKHQEFAVPDVASSGLPESGTPPLICFEDALDESSFQGSDVSHKAIDEKLFSLDLDKLECLSLPSLEKLSLPTLLNLSLDE